MNPVFRAIADPTRRCMLQRLTAGPRAAGELGRGLSMSQPAISQHLRVLRQAGLVTVRRVGRQREYHLHAEGLRAVHTWAATFEAFWSTVLDELELVLIAMARSVRPPSAQGPILGVLGVLVHDFVCTTAQTCR